MVVLELERIPLAATAAAMLLLALWLVALDFGKAANRVFALILAARGLALLGPQLATDPAWTGLAVALQPYWVLPLVPLTLYFASVYPWRRGPLRRKGAGWAVLAVGLALELAYLLNHGLMYTTGPGTAEVGALQAARGVVYTSFGPLALLALAIGPVSAVLAMLFVRDYARAPAGLQRTTLLLVASGFILNGLFDGMRAASDLVHLTEATAAGAAFPWAWGWAVAFVPVLALPPSLMALFLLVRAHRDSPPTDRRIEWRVLALAPLALATGLLPLLLPASQSTHPAVLTLMGLWRLTLPAFVTYALLHYSLFEIDVKVRSVVTAIVFVAAYGVTYLAVSTLVGSMTSEWVGGLAGSMAATSLLLVTAPIGSWARRVASAIVPSSHGDPGERVAQQERLVAGTPTARERKVLDRIRRHKAA